MPTEAGPGYCWPDAVGTPTDPTEAFDPTLGAVELYIQHSTRLFGVIESTGTPCEAVQVRVDSGRLVAGVLQWTPIAIKTVPAVDDVRLFVVDCTEAMWVRLIPRRIGGGVNSTIALYVTPRRPIGTTLGIDGQPVELTAAQGTGVVLWDNGAGAAEATGGAYALGPAGTGHWLAVGEATEVVLYATLTGGPSTTIELQVQESPDPTLVAPITAIHEVVNSVSGGIDRRAPGELQINGANGTYMVRLPVRPGTFLRLWAKDTGASSNLIVRGYPYRVGA